MRWPSKSTYTLFAAAYLLTLLVTAPASLLDASLQYATGGRLLLVYASGTVWEGSATLALRMQDKQLIGLSFLRWEIEWPSLFTGKLRMRLQPDHQPLAAEAIVSFSQVELHRVQLELPARLLSEASIMLKPLQLRGQLKMQADHLVFSSHGMAGSALVDWRQASSAIFGLNALGDYRMTLAGAGERIPIVLATTSGILLLEGEGNWWAKRGLEFHGKASASSGNYDTLTELLHHLGPEATPGVHTFDFVPQ